MIHWSSSPAWCLLAVSPTVFSQMSAGATVTWRLDWAGCLRRPAVDSVSWQGVQGGCWLERLNVAPPRALPCSHCDSWIPGGSVPRTSIPRGRKQKLPGPIRAMPAAGTVPLPPYSHGPRVTASPHIQGDRRREYLLMEEWQGQVAEDCRIANIVMPIFGRYNLLQWDTFLGFWVLLTWRHWSFIAALLSCRRYLRFYSLMFCLRPWSSHFSKNPQSLLLFF